MNETVYIVCTRSAVSASALVYMMNQSPDFYHVAHNDIWLSEHSNEFGVAATLNDWWNIPDELDEYHKGVRNAETLEYGNVRRLCQQWQDLNTGRNIALFSHAKNAQQIEQDTQDLPVKFVSTLAGPNFEKFIGLWIKREYNTIMNDYESFESAIYNALDIQYGRDKWNPAQQTITMNDWLVGDFYSKLNITPAPIDIWRKQYLFRNDFNSVLPDDHVVTRIRNILQILNTQTTDYFTAKKLLYAILHTAKGKTRDADWDSITQTAKQLIGLY